MPPPRRRRAGGREELRRHAVPLQHAQLRRRGRSPRRGLRQARPDPTRRRPRASAPSGGGPRPRPARGARRRQRYRRRWEHQWRPRVGGAAAGPALWRRRRCCAEVALPLAVEQAHGPASGGPRDVQRAGPGAVQGVRVGALLQEEPDLRRRPRARARVCARAYGCAVRGCRCLRGCFLPCVRASVRACACVRARVCARVRVCVRVRRGPGGRWTQKSKPCAAASRRRPGRARAAVPARWAT
jgi:hypothetical protein